LNTNYTLQRINHDSLFAVPKISKKRIAAVNNPNKMSSSSNADMKGSVAVAGDGHPIKVGEIKTNRVSYTKNELF
jgi:hypothetical protein